MIDSIRGRLFLSHALVALFSALLLGGLVVASLATYYRWREQQYLADNGVALSNLLAGMILEPQDLMVVEAQVSTFSFLTQTRVKLLDTAGQVLVDSGSPDQQTAVASISLTVEEDDRVQSLSRTFEPDTETLNLLRRN